jgi:hypothetical protein
LAQPKLSPCPPLRGSGWLAEAYRARGDRIRAYPSSGPAYQLDARRETRRQLAREPGIRGSRAGSPQAVRIAAVLSRAQSKPLPRVRAVQLEGGRIQFEADRPLLHRLQP